MPQRQKPEVREAILAAAGDTFAEVGFERATLVDIVDRADTSIGNLYKYFPNKEELFAAFIPEKFKSDLTRRIRAQVEALGDEVDALSLPVDHPYQRASAELLRFTLEHRARIAFLLLRSEGTKHARFPGELVRLLVELAVRYARETYPNMAVTPAKKRALDRIYSAYVATLGSVLQEERTPRALLQAIGLQITYHLAGLRAFFLAAQSNAATRKASP